MLAGLFVQLIVSLITKQFLEDDFSKGKPKNLTGVVQSHSGAALIDCTLNVSYLQVELKPFIKLRIGYNLSPGTVEYLTLGK